MKSYAAIYPDFGSMTLLQRYNDKQEIIEHRITRANQSDSNEAYDKMFSDIKAKVDKKIVCICLFVRSWPDERKMQILFSASKNDILNVQIIDEYKMDSIDAILQSQNTLKNNLIIWTCGRKKNIVRNIYEDYFCIWKGKTCEVMKCDVSKMFLEGLLITTKSPPDILLYKKEDEKCFDKTFINYLLPGCKIVEDERKTSVHIVKGYLQMLSGYDLDLNSNKTFNVAENVEYKRNNKKTAIHVGISDILNIVCLVYCYDGIEREFTLTLKKSWSSKEQRNDIEEKLKIAEARLNGELGCICILSFSNFTASEWAKQIGFKEAKIIEQNEAEYIEAVLQVPVKIKHTDVVWMGSYSNYEIWQDFIFQKNFKDSQLKEVIPTLKQSPVYIIFKSKNCKEYREAELKKYFPECQFLYFNCQITYNTLMKCIYLMVTNSKTMLLGSSYNVIKTSNLDVQEGYLIFREVNADSNKPFGEENCNFERTFFFSLIFVHIVPYLVILFIGNHIKPKNTGKG